MANHIINREKIMDVLFRELVGPMPEGEEIDIAELKEFEKKEDAYGPFRVKGTGEEILMRDPPTKRYGVGVLYPFATEEEIKTEEPGFVSEEETGISPEDDIEREKLVKSTEKAREKIERSAPDTNAADFDLSSANTYKPSSIGISFLAEFQEGSKLIIEGEGGRYKEIEIKIRDNPKSRSAWARSPVSIRAEFAGKDIVTSVRRKLTPAKPELNNTEGMDIQIELYSRPFDSNHDIRLITICMVNRAKGNSTDTILFQSGFKAILISADKQAHILPYPRPAHEKLDEEEKSLELLYRNASTFAVGHGCAADWERTVKNQRVSWVKAECFPVFETPSITPDVYDEFGNQVRVPMAELAGIKSGDDGFESLESVVTAYQKWISNKQLEVNDLEERYQEAASNHLQNCTHCVERMKTGIKFLRTNKKALDAFRWANYAILLQQIHLQPEPRKIILDEKAARISFSKELVEPDPLKTNSNKGYWRAFQIAFLLMTIESTANSTNVDRETVELIWFPTGGGKTEAYLGLAAFALFLRRINDPEDDGVHTIMRYTLRLLTTQQFQRAARLICAMEYIRRRNKEKLGNKPFSIGMWVGGANTPNTRSEAVTLLKNLSKGDRTAQNLFVLDRCPWCGAQMGPLEDDQMRKKSIFPRVHGYLQSGKSVIYKCPDSKCEFKNSLPILVIDEDIYEQPPSMIIGTVDKFAMLAWKPEARSIFGIGRDGLRIKTPPGLIIQDELHLISGPLGSMVGLYETVIEELCTDRRSSDPVRPKIISSTATIRRYEDQIKALYGRKKVALFPPPGLEDGDSFFARYATSADGKLAPGRIYIGIHAPGLGSMQTVQVRTFTALLQSPMRLPEDERDPWWTLLVFFNSLRELGTTLTLLQSDIPDYQRAYMNRFSLSQRVWRSFYEVNELTGRASSEDVPKAISALERRYPSQSIRPVDVCLASNILEVGVDIDRLSLMAVVGQPKTTSQYIQVTGRIGRSWWERPGVVVTIYSASKPRDRSHFEKFRSYHEQLYAQVEPTSVTPFSPPALDRALHAVIALYALQTGNESIVQSPFPYPENLLDQLKLILLPRVQAIDPQEVVNFEKVFEQRKEEWRNWQPVKWIKSREESDIPLLRRAGAYATKEQKNQSWSTMQSMRSVDAECIAEIVTPTIVEGEKQDAS